MGTEIVSTDKFGRIVFEALGNLQQQLISDSAEADVFVSDTQELGKRLREEFVTLQKGILESDNATQGADAEDSANQVLYGMQYFAELVVYAVKESQDLTRDYALFLLNGSNSTSLTPEGSVEPKVSSNRLNPHDVFNTSGWDGRSWHHAAKHPHAATKGSYLEFSGDAKDVFVDFLEDGIKETLTKGALDFATSQASVLVSLIFGQGVVALLSQAPILCTILGFSLLFLLRHSQSDAVDVPKDCACVWEHIRQDYAANGFTKPSHIIDSFQRQGSLHSRPYNLAPCEPSSQARVPSCPFRYHDQQSKSCCRLAYETDDSFGLETRDDKIVRTFQKLVSLGLLETRIDQSPDHYYLV